MDYLRILKRDLLCRRLVYGIKKEEIDIRIVAFACSLTFVSLTLLFEYRMVLDWVTEEDWSAMLDVVPTMSSALTGYVILMIPVNLLPMFLAGRKKE